MAERHVIERTSPKGEKFIGTCMRCGRTGLEMRAVWDECDNVSGMTDDEALLAALVGLESSRKPG